MKNLVNIYSIEYPEGNIRYIGKTKLLVEDRLLQHMKAAKCGVKSYSKDWLRSLLKQGNTPVIKTLDIVDESDWQFWEIYYISLYKSWGFSLTNHTVGGEGIDIDSIRRGHATRKARLMSGEIVVWNKGRTGIYSEEHRRHLSELASKRIQSEESNKKRSDKQKGLKRSEITKQKMSKSFKGRIIREETKEKISKTLTGRKQTEDQIEKARLTRIGKHRSEETKYKIHKANLGRKMDAEFCERLSRIHKGKNISIKMRESISNTWFNKHEVTCPFCFKVGKDVGNFKRYHFDNCLFNPNIVLIKCPHCGRKSNSSNNMRVYHFDNCKNKK